MNVDDVIRERIARAKVRAEAEKARRLAITANRQAGLAARHANKLRRLNAAAEEGQQIPPTPKPTEKENTMTIPAELINAFESNHDMWPNEGQRPQLTAYEREAIDRYNRAVEGYVDYLDAITADFFAGIEEEDGTEAAREAARQHFAALSRWYEALDSLYTDLSHPEHGPHNTGMRLLEHQANLLFRLLNLARREVVQWLLGTAGPYPEVDSGVLTFGDVPPRIQLNGTALAESI